MDEDTLIYLCLKNLCISDLIFVRQTDQLCHDWGPTVDKLIDERNQSKELIIFIECIPYSAFFWKHDDRPIDLRNSVYLDRTIVIEQNFRDYFQSIKRLLIVFSTECFSENLLSNFINSFHDLEHLQINFQTSKILNHFYFMSNQCDINLSNLRTLYTDVSIGRINCPQLEYFSATDCQVKVPFNDFSFSNWKFLCCRSFERTYCKSLTSLKTLILTKQDSKVSLELFPNLKVLSIYLTINSDVNTLRNVLNLNEVVYRMNRGLEFYCNGLRRYTTPVLEPMRKSRPNYRLKMNNFDQSLFWSLPVDYKLMEIYIDDKFEVCFRLFKLNCLTLLYCDSFGALINELNGESYDRSSRWFNQLIIYKEIDNELFLRSKEFFKYVYTIKLEKLVQPTLDLLPELFPYLKRICINPLVLENSKNINLRFLNKFRNLTAFEVLDENRFSLDDLKQVLNNCRYFELGIFKHFVFFIQNGSNESKKIDLERRDNYRFFKTTRIKDSKWNERIRFKSMIEFYEYLVKERLIKTNNKLPLKRKLSLSLSTSLSFST